MGGFEAIARTMLKGAEPVAHDCKLKLAETAPLKLWRFGFNANVKNDGLTTTGGTNGTFMTRPNERRNRSARPAQGQRHRAQDPQGLEAGRLGHAPRHRPLSFKYSYGVELRAEVKVTATTYAPCSKGATGTLMVSTNTRTATLVVCGRNMIQGTGYTAPNITG